MKKVIISTKNAPSAIGPYSQGVCYGDLIFASGQVPTNPATGELVNDNITVATKQALENVKNLLESVGSSLENVIKVSVFLKDLGDFDNMNKVYSEYFEKDLPARTTVQVAGLPKGALVEIEVVAHK